MRTVVSGLMALVALVLAAAAIPAAWLDRNVVSQEGFVQLAGPLGTDPEFQAALARDISQQAAAASGVPDALAPLVQPMMEEAASRVTELPGYQQAWSETLRRSHELNLGGATQNPSGTAGERLVLDATPLVALVAEEISTVLGVPVPEPGPALVPVAGPDELRAVESLRSAAVWPWLAAGAVVAGLLALLSARRTSAALTGLGLGLALTGGLYWLAMQAGSSAVRQAPAGSEAAQAFKEALVSRVAESFGLWIGLTLAGAAVLVVLGLGSRLAAGRR
jgi:hypothetical protein